VKDFREVTSVKLQRFKLYDDGIDHADGSVCDDDVSSCRGLGLNVTLLLGIRLLINNCVVNMELICVKL
jgi:hypothetical protein